MGGQKFQYDESGGTFFYFLISFLALLLIPGTYYYWPRRVFEGNIFLLFSTIQFFVWLQLNKLKRRFILQFISIFLTWKKLKGFLQK
jgi:hypothetical protein